ncbi:MAG: hypothetical protein KAU07_03680 [Candidatus Andersenbacteria bacterium]|nr:hypothetical protein [Candidatus Andersenbacteria bacterium]
MKIELPETKMVSLSELEAYRKRIAFTLFAVEMQKEANGIAVIIPDDPLAAINKEDRKVMEFTKGDFWRWSAGGLLVTLEKKDGERISLVLLRDKKAPTYAGHMTACTGLGADFDEALDPSLVMIREGLEELIIVIKRQGVVLPVFNNMETEVDIDAIISNGASLREETANFSFVECTASVLNLSGQQTIEVFWKEELQSTSSCIIAIDEGVNGIDCLGAIKIKVPVNSWSELEIFDGEVFGGGEPLNRDVYGLDRDNKPIALWRFGQSEKPTKQDFPKTEVLKVLLNALK